MTPASKMHPIGKRFMRACLRGDRVTMAHFVVVRATAKTCDVQNIKTNRIERLNDTFATTTAGAVRRLYNETCAGGCNCYDLLHPNRQRPHWLDSVDEMAVVMRFIRRLQRHGIIK